MSKMLDFIFKLDVFMTNGFSNSFSKASHQVSELQAKTKALNTVSGKIDSYQKRSRSLQTLQDKLAGAKQRELQLSDQMNFGTQANAKLYKEYSNAVKESQRLTREYESQKKSLNELGRELEGSGININNMTRAQEQLSRASEQSTAKLRRLQEAQAKVAAFNPKEIWQNIKGDVMAVAGYVNMFQKPIKLSADFESAMARVQAAGFVRTGSDMSQLEELRKQALHLGDSTQYTSIEAAATQETLIRGGLKVPDVIKIMPTVMSMATAENLPLNRSAEILVGLDSAMDITSDKASHTADVLAIMSASYKTNIDSMYEGMSKAAGIAHTLKMPIEHLAALSAIAQQLGVDASTAGTSIKTGLIRISSDAKKLSKLGITIKDREGNFRSIDQILSELSSKLQKYGPIKQVEILGDIFGKNSVDTWSKLISGQGRGMVSEAINIANTESDGTTQKMQDIIMQTYNGSKSLFESSIAGLQTWIGDKVKPIQEYVMEKATGAVSSVTQMLKANESVSAPVTQAAFLGGGAFAGYKVASYAGKAIQFGKAWINLKMAESAVAGVSAAAETAAVSTSTAIGTAASAVSGIETAAVSTATAVESIGAASGTAASAVSAGASSMIASLGAVSAIVTAIYDNWQRFKSEGIHMHDELIKMKSMSGSNRDTSQSSVRTSTFGGRKRALGGLITRPEIALIGEAGPEAIIPLSPGKKSRGLQVLNQAADSLGVNIMPPEMRNITSQIMNNNNNNMNTNNIIRNIASESQNAGDIFTQSESLVTNRGGNNEILNANRTNNINPVINITVNASGSELNSTEGHNIANNIYDRVREALSEIMNDNDRLSFA